MAGLEAGRARELYHSGCPRNPEWRASRPTEHVGYTMRRLLDGDFATTKLFESTSDFARRMKQVEVHLNSDRFAAPGGGGLLALAKEMPARCDEVIKRQGERIPK